MLYFKSVLYSKIKKLIKINTYKVFKNYLLYFKFTSNFQQNIYKEINLGNEMNRLNLFIRIVNAVNSFKKVFNGTK